MVFRLPPMLTPMKPGRGDLVWRAPWDFQTACVALMACTFLGGATVGYAMMVTGGSRLPTNLLVASTFGYAFWIWTGILIGAMRGRFAVYRNGFRPRFVSARRILRHRMRPWVPWEEVERVEIADAWEATLYVIRVSADEVYSFADHDPPGRQAAQAVLSLWRSRGGTIADLREASTNGDGRDQARTS